MINKYIRVIIVIAVLTGIVLLAKNKTAWAGSATRTDQVADLGQVELSAPLIGSGPGSVKPPPASVKGCKTGIFSVGGAITLEINDLKPGYCVEADLWNPNFGLGRIPDDAGKVLAHMGFIRIYYHGSLIYELPAEDGTIEICFAIPPKKQAQIYFYDFYGPRFEKRIGPPTWDVVDNTIENSIACTFAQKSGVYALIGK